MSKSQINYLYDVNGDYKGVNFKKIENDKLVENFITTFNSTVKKDLKEITKNIDRDTVIKGTSMFLSAVINEVSNRNTDELNQFITLSNSFEIGRVEISGDFVLKNFKQTGNFDNTLNINTSQVIRDRIITEISNTIKNKIENVVKSVIYDKGSFGESTNLGSSLVGMTEDVLGNIGCTLSMSFGNSTSLTTSKKEINKVKKQLNLDETFTAAKNSDIVNTITSLLNSENIAKCVAKTKSSNIFKINKDNAITNNKPEQLAAIKNVLNCTFNQQVLEVLSDKLINDLNENISRMIVSADRKISDTNNTSSSNDIQAVDVIGTTILEGIGNGIVTLPKEIYKEKEKEKDKDTDKNMNVIDVCKSQGINYMFYGMTVPLIIIVILIMIVIYLKLKGNF